MSSIIKLSELLLHCERLALGGLMALLTALILLNVVTRYTGFPLYWVDESAVYTTVWLTFIGASAMTRLRLDFAVTLLTDRLDRRSAQVIRVVATLCILGFGLALAAMCWSWMDPIGIARAGFDARAYSATTFNFLYSEHTQTLNWPSWIVYLVVPLFAFGLIIHAAANLVEDLGLAARPDHSRFGIGSAEEIA